MSRNDGYKVGVVTVCLLAVAFMLAGCPISTPPSITAQPESQTVSVGDSVTFTISASGSTPFTFQWRNGGVDISGATASSYQITAVQTSDQGSYTCLVSNGSGSVESNVAVLTVDSTPPMIDAQPQSQVVGPGDYVSFAVTATGAGTLTYEWRKDGAAISRATTDYYEIASALVSDSGNYTCRVSNPAGNTDSDAAELVVSVEYGQGYDAGFALDEWYWKGFDDSNNTMAASPMYYQGGTIPFVETPYYDRGYDDGIWYAYNDGYFVSYDDAFTIGFSEGYDAAYFSGYLTFLAADQHVEYNNGGWGDGYNDGFSEGRVFGANDYEQGLDFDWIDALLDYRSGTDLYFSEINVGTGSYGPVVLYEYGTDPTAAKAALEARSDIFVPRMAVRLAERSAAKSGDSLYRTLTPTEEAKFQKTPTTTPRSSRKLTLTTSWLERLQAYQQAENSSAKSLRLHAVHK